MSQPFTKIGLDLLLQGACQHPGCECKGQEHDPVRYLHGSCHPGSPTWAFYKPGGILTIECAKCRRMIVEIKVAET